MEIHVDDIVIPGLGIYPNLDEQVLILPITRKIADGTPDQIKLVMDGVFERQTQAIAQMASLKSKPNRKTVPVNASFPEGTMMLKTPDCLEITGSTTDITFKLGAEKTFETSTGGACLPESFPRRPMSELVIGNHSDLQTDVDMAEFLAMRPKDKRHLDTRFYFREGKLGKLVTLTPSIGEKFSLARIRYKGLSYNPAFGYFAQEPTFLDAILYQAYMNELMLGLNAFKVK